MLQCLESLPRRGKQWLAVFVDACVFAVSLWLGLAIKLEVFWPQIADHSMAQLYAVAAGVGIASCWGCGLYREVTRYVGFRFAFRVANAVTVATIILVAIAFLVADRANGIPRSASVIFWMSSLIGIGSARALARYAIRSMSASSSSRILIYGAGDVGAGLLALLAQDRRSTVVGFLDDHPDRIGREIRSLRVYSGADVTAVVRATKANAVLLALPESSRRRRRELFDQLSRENVKVMLVPTLKEIADGTSQIAALQPIKLEDLLGRPPIEPMLDLLTKNIASANVLVTGAGGSIGQEIARQVLKLGPRSLIVLDNCEFNLYNLEKDLRAQCANSTSIKIVPVLASVLDRVRLERVMSEHAIETVFHAAAYKHIPIVEMNEVEGVNCNTIGTLRTAQAAIRTGVRSFVLISTDKAVRPTSVMGASKRLAEKCLQALAAESQGSKTRFTMVRFGNVLGSSGSVVPHFEDQIRRGGPVTVTHADVTRYFMTIPEAASLVIQAGAMGRGGDVFVLDMGEPVLIMQLARSMIRLAGYREKTAEFPGGDIEIQCTGMRPGEKLYEELIIGDNCGPTEHPAILRAQEKFTPWMQLEPAIERLEAAIDQHDVARVRSLLRELVSGYLVDHADFSVGANSPLDR